MGTVVITTGLAARVATLPHAGVGQACKDVMVAVTAAIQASVGIARITGRNCCKADGVMVMASPAPTSCCASTSTASATASPLSRTTGRFTTRDPMFTFSKGKG